MVYSIDKVVDMQTSSYAPGDCIIAGGYHHIGDGGGGTFVCKDLVGGLPNGWRYDGGLIIRSLTPSAIYFQRLVDTPYVSVKWFGAKGDNSWDDREAVSEAINANTGGTGFNVYAGGGLPYAITLRPMRSRVYFPAGIYLFSEPIYDAPHPTQYHHEKQGAQFYGEYAILKPAFGYPGPVATTQPIPPLLSLGAVIDTKFSTLTFKGFPFVMNIDSYNLDSGDLMVENCNFSDIVYASDPFHPGPTASILLNMQSSYAEIRNCHWRNCQHAIWQRNGQTYVNGGRIRDFAWVENYDAQIVLYGTEWLQMENTVCTVPNVGTLPYSATCSWVKSYGHFKATNVKFRPAEGHLPNMLSVVRAQLQSAFSTWTTGTSNNDSYEGGQLRLVDCETACAAEVVTLIFIPCRIILQDNFGFINNAPVIKYAHVTPLKNIVNNMQAMLSIKLDNIPNMPTRQPNRIYKAGDNKQQLLLLPFMRVDTGLTSYGYLEDLNGSPQPQELRFYMGRTSFNTNVFNGPAWPWVKSAMWANYSFVIKLYNLIENGFPADMGKIVEYTEYRIEVYTYHVPNNPAKYNRIKLVELISGGTNPNSPVLVWDAPNDNVYVKSKGTEEPYEPYIYSIFYEITSMIPPLAIV